jgi:hypothetical protein
MSKTVEWSNHVQSAYRHYRHPRLAFTVPPSDSALTPSEEAAILSHVRQSLGVDGLQPDPASAAANAFAALATGEASHEHLRDVFAGMVRGIDDRLARLLDRLSVSDALAARILPSHWFGDGTIALNAQEWAGRSGTIMAAHISVLSADHKLHDYAPAGGWPMINLADGRSVAAIVLGWPQGGAFCKQPLPFYGLDAALRLTAMLVAHNARLDWRREDQRKRDEAATKVASRLRAQNPEVLREQLAALKGRVAEIENALFISEESGEAVAPANYS